MRLRRRNKLELSFKILAIVGLALLVRGVMLGEVVLLSKNVLMFAGIMVAALVLLD